MLKKGIDSASDKKSKAILTEYNNKLEELRSKLLATKQTSIFADEQRLREQISELYLAVVVHEAAPSNLQIASVTALQQEVIKAEQTSNTLNNTYLAKATEAINKTEALKKKLQPKLNNGEIKK
jgi:hypothetical protein